MTIVDVAVGTGGRRFVDFDRIRRDLLALRQVGLHRVAQGESPGGGADLHLKEQWRILVGDVMGDPPGVRGGPIAPGSLRIPRLGMCTEGLYPEDDDLDGTTRQRFNRRNTRMVTAEIARASHHGLRLVGLGYPDPTSTGTWHCLRELMRFGAPAVVWLPALTLTRIVELETSGRGEPVDWVAGIVRRKLNATPYWVYACDRLLVAPTPQAFELLGTAASTLIYADGMVPPWVPSDSKEKT